MKTAAVLLVGVMGLAWNCGGAIPDNDHFATRITLIGTNISTAGNNISATKEIGEPDPDFAGGRSVWWTWTAPVDGYVTLTTAGSTFDTMLTVFTGSALSNLALLAFNTTNDTERSTTMVTFNALAGTAYQIAVDGYDGTNSTGDISLQLSLGPPQAPPTNDNFADRITISGDHLSNVPGSNVGATAEPREPFHADAIGQKSVWWTWTAPASGGLTLTSQGTSTLFGGALDTLLAVYTGNSVTNLTLIAANDEDSHGYESTVTCNVISNVTYQIAVDGFEGDEGDIRLRLDLGTAFPTPPNDNFANRIVLTSATTVVTNGSNVGATMEAKEPMHLLTFGGKSVWWRWTAPMTGSVELSTTNSAIDTILCVYRGNSLTNLVFVAGNDEASETEHTSLAYFNATAGTNYQIVVDGYDGAEGDINLSLNMDVADPVPANNNFANRIQITGTNTTVTGSNIGATLETGEPLHLGYYGGLSVWWRWTSPNAGFVTMDTIGSTFDTMLAVYTNTSLTNLVEIAADDEGAANHTSRVMFPTRSNVTYQIAVDGNDGDAGDISLHVSFAPASYSLTLATNPAGAGSVSVSPLPDQGGKYAPGSVVTLAATPSNNYSFFNWSGAITATDNPLLFLMNSNRSLTAGFALLPAPTLVPWQPQTEANILTNGFRLLLSGPTNSPYAIERSTNLSNWISFKTNQASLVQPTEVLDPGATNQPSRFYRARRLP